jgi:hypothetical protein
LTIGVIVNWQFGLKEANHDLLGECTYQYEWGRIEFIIPSIILQKRFFFIATPSVGGNYIKRLNLRWHLSDP